MLSGYNNNYKYTGMEQDAETDLRRKTKRREIRIRTMLQFLSVH